MYFVIVTFCFKETLLLGNLAWNCLTWETASWKSFLSEKLGLETCFVGSNYLLELLKLGIAYLEECLGCGLFAKKMFGLENCTLGIFQTPLLQVRLLVLLTFGMTHECEASLLLMVVV